MERILFQNLLAWKNKRDRKPLILNGVRQCGKTFLLKKFGEKCFQNTHYLNFEKEPILSDFFSSSLNPLKIIEKLSFYLNTSINLEKDLIIFDEIQECSKALTSLKYFCEELPSAAICGAGSLLGLHLNAGSFPVGKVTFETLRPMNFEEFLMALDDKALAFFQDVNSYNELDREVHEHLLERLKHYFIVGGLPEAVLTYREHREHLFEAFQKVRKKQEDLINAYYADIAKHSGKVNAMHIDRVLRSVAAQLEKEYDGSVQRYKFKGVIPGISHYDRLAGAIDWLESTGLILKIHTLNTAQIPFKGYVRENFFKLLLFDIGLLAAIVNLDPKVILDYDFGSYKGYFAESFVAQELISYQNTSLFSWQEKHYEIEFIQAFEGRPIPLEVKSGKKIKHASLRAFNNKYSPLCQIIISSRLPEVNSKSLIKKIPLYWASKWKDFLEPKL